MDEIKVIELFAGIGEPRKALERAKIRHSIVGISENDKFAIESYNAIFGKTQNWGDITKIDSLPYADLWVYGSPCQDFSCSGKQLGFNGTRSILLLEVKRLLEDSIKKQNQPKYLLLENVKNLVGKKFKVHFDEWISYLDSIGYNTYWQVLNATDFNVPQNRERVFAVSIRKDIDTGYIFPKGNGLHRRIKDIIEESVEEKYYLNEEMQKRFFERFKDYKPIDRNNMIKLGNCSQNITSQAGAVYDINGVSPTLTAGTHGYAMGNILEPIIVASRGRYIGEGGSVAQHLEPNFNGISNTLTTVQKDNLLYYKSRVRRLTPLECIRLMGFDDKDYYNMRKVNMSDTQIYKQCGNSIVVNILEEIFTKLLTKYKE